MKIYVEQIPESGLEISEAYPPQALDLERTDVKFTGPINVSCWVTKGINHITIVVNLKATMHFNCGRCLEEFVIPLSKEIKINYLLKQQQKEVIDITDNIREEMLFSYPLKPLCKLDCQGLCPVCGQNLNNGECKHGTTKKTAF